LFVRISATDWADGGWNAEESVALSKILKEKRCDLIDVSSGACRTKKIPRTQLPSSLCRPNKTWYMTEQFGLITEAKQAEESLQRWQPIWSCSLGSHCVTLI
jgi:2,4-dienoyl-CoA reductase-like NADH-dependent reductase (Old Yellow Enzyme family)